MFAPKKPEPLLKSPKISHQDQTTRADNLRGVVQAGIAFPSPSDQTQLLIVRIDLAPAQVKSNQVSSGLGRLCRLFADIDAGKKRISVLDDNGRVRLVSLREEFSFSATIGFGEGFFTTLGIPESLRPSKLKPMPDHEGLGDTTPYSLGQTDFVVQLGSSSAFVNRWVLENSLQPSEAEGAPSADTSADIVSALGDWATITDVHTGFQRTDGRNLQGFNDGVSNPRANSDQFNAVVWTKNETNSALNMGTYMVFQKIIHDLDQWRELDIDEQQEWVGRSKGTGLLLGTLSDEQDDQLADGLRKGDPEAFSTWKKFFDLQSFPQIPFFTPEAITELPPGVDFSVAEVQAMASRNKDRCPAWSHVRKVNPRGGDGVDFRLIFRRGYPFMESSLDNKLRSGLLFISFQNDIEATFEFIKLRWAGDGSFPVPALRAFSESEIESRHRGGRFSSEELKQFTPDARKLLGLGDPDAFKDALDNAAMPITQQTGREGLAGPSEHGVTPTGEFQAIVPLGGGYYFVPPLPAGGVAEIGQLFFAPPAAARTGSGGAPTTDGPKVAGAMRSRGDSQSPASAGRRAYKIVPLIGHPHKPSRLAAPAAAAGELPLVYHGGALISKIEVFTVFFGAAWQTPSQDPNAASANMADNLNEFLKFLVNCPLMTQLKEYSVQNFRISPGSFAGSVVIPGPLSATMTNARMQTNLQELIAAGQVPQPSPNALYFLFLPPDIVSELDGDHSCQQFCGFHDSINNQIFYAVIPFAKCPGCTRGFSIFDSLTRVVSHEFCEAITNPDGQGWFTEPPDGTPGDEIGDLCSEGTKQLGNFKVQTEFSNEAMNCV
jgi:Dyp-type peroxidase family